MCADPRCGRTTHQHAYTQYFYNTRVGCPCLWALGRGLAATTRVPASMQFGATRRWVATAVPVVAPTACRHFASKVPTRAHVVASLAPPALPCFRRRRCDVLWHRQLRSGGWGGWGLRRWARGCARSKNRSTSPATPTTVRFVVWHAASCCGLHVAMSGLQPGQRGMDLPLLCNCTCCALQLALPCSSLYLAVRQPAWPVGCNSSAMLGCPNTAGGCNKSYAVTTHLEEAPRVFSLQVNRKS